MARDTDGPVGGVAGACLLGTAIEWYDFFVYGAAAALVFGTLFFPASAPSTGTLAALSLVAAGFAARPLGAAVVSHVGDRVGRRTALVATLLITGSSTVAIGLLPTYEQVGAAAPAALVALRFVQGIAVGGEWGGAVLLAVEHAPPRRRGLYAGLPQLGLPLGILTANLAFLPLTSVLDGEQFRSWGWRVPFVLSAVLVAVGLYVRARVTESPLFTAMAAAAGRTRRPVLEVLRQSPGTVLLITASHLALPTITLVHLVYTLTYATGVLGMSRPFVVASIVVFAAAMLVSLVPFAHWSDRVGRRPVLLGGSVGLVVGAACYFPALESRSSTLFVIVAAGLGVASAAVSGPIPAVFSELFGTRVRYSGASLGFQLSVTLGGLAPVAAVPLMAAGGSGLVTLYLVLAGLVSLAAVAALPETSGGELADDLEPPIGATARRES